MNTTAQAGFTLIELMTAIALTTVLSGAMFALGNQANRSAATTTTLGDRLEGYRRAMRLLADDLRAARTVATGATGDVIVDSPEGQTTWRLDGEVLLRGRRGREAAVARSVLGLLVTPCSPTWAIELRISERTTLRSAIARRVEVAR